MPEDEKPQEPEQTSELYGNPEEILQTGITGKPYEGEPLSPWLLRMYEQFSQRGDPRAFASAFTPARPRTPSATLSKRDEMLLTIVIGVFCAVPFPAQIKVGIWSLAALLLAHIAYRYFKDLSNVWNGLFAAAFVLTLEALLLGPPIRTTLFPPPSYEVGLQQIYAQGAEIENVLRRAATDQEVKIATNHIDAWYSNSELWIGQNMSRAAQDKFADSSNWQTRKYGGPFRNHITQPELVKRDDYANRLGSDLENLQYMMQNPGFDHQ